MASRKQRAAARRNIKKAAKAARRKRTISRLPKKNTHSARQAGGQGRKTPAQEENRALTPICLNWGLTPIQRQAA